MEPIPDYLNDNMKILFVGFNPSLRSSETGHHYANPTNRFWNILYQAGLTDRVYRSEEDKELLSLGYGLTNIVARPTKAAADISKEEYERGAEILKQKIKRYRPKVVCFVGKGVYQQYSGKGQVDWGLQERPTLPETQEFVAPSSSGLVRMKLADIVHIYKGIKSLL